MLKTIIADLIARAKKHTRPNGAVEYTFAGFVTTEVRQAIWAAYRAGNLTMDRVWLFASKDDCHVAFRFGHGASTANYCWFSYVDERPLRQAQAPAPVQAPAKPRQLWCGKPGQPASIEASALRGAEPCCPQCQGQVTVAHIVSVDRNGRFGEVAGWHHVHDCGAKLLIIND